LLTPHVAAFVVTAAAKPGLWGVKRHLPLIRPGNEGLERLNHHCFPLRYSLLPRADVSRALQQLLLLFKDSCRLASDICAELCNGTIKLALALLKAAVPRIEFGLTVVKLFATLHRKKFYFRL
jgi:hypothetical protein